MKRIAVYLTLVFIFESCTFFEAKKVDENLLFEEELKALNLEEVDVYPSFETCETNESTSENSKCLQHVLSAYLVKELQQYPNELSSFYQQQLDFYFTVYANSKFTLDSVSSSNKHNTLQVGTVAGQNLHQLPKLFPAQKRGIPVTTSFSVPVVVK